MVKKILLLFVLFAAACAAEDPAPYVVLDAPAEEIVEEPTKEVVESTPIVEKTCRSDCTRDSCISLDYYECIQSKLGCGVLDKKGIVEGKCGVTCIVDDDCDSGQECSFGNTGTKCVNKNDD